MAGGSDEDMIDVRAEGTEGLVETFNVREDWWGVVGVEVEVS